MEDKAEGVKTIIGKDFNAKTGQRGWRGSGGGWDRER